MRGIGDIADLRLEVLTDLVTRFTTPPELMLTTLFGETDAPSDSIKWESYEGTRGMAPFVPPGVPSPRTAPLGVTKHTATAATWKEKMYFDEEFLNNLREPGTVATYMAAKTRLARESASLSYRSMRRKEWMIAKMLFSGKITYEVTGGMKAEVDYKLPTANNVTLTTNYMWPAGSTKDILGDIMDAKKTVKDACGVLPSVAMCTTNVLKMLAQDTTIRQLLKKSDFGNGDLFTGTRGGILGVNPKVIQSLLDIPRLEVYDEVYEVRAYLTAGVTASSSTVISVEDASDFEAGSYLRFVDVSEGTWEDCLIDSVSVPANTVTIHAAPAASYRAVEDYCFVRKTFLPTNKFVMFAPVVEGKPIAEFLRAPYGLSRLYGRQADTHETWDPDGIFLRVQDKGLPVLYQRDAIYNLTVTSTTPNI